MIIAQSRLTAQGQISIPVAVRRKLGLTPGAVLDWDEVDGNIVLRRSGRFDSADIHRALFPTPPVPKSDADLKTGIRQNMRKRHSGGHARG
ncbi:MAG: AbrB/MazE/SpoVT family DNA-binding domain-containing protein [Panacagrimonas sp.]